jgi:hypothetical protein
VRSTDDAGINAFLDSFAEALLVDLADSPDDEDVPIGRFLLEVFEAEKRGYTFDEDLCYVHRSAGELRESMRDLRERVALETA